MLTVHDSQLRYAIDARQDSRLAPCDGCSAVKHLVDGLIDGLHGGIVCNSVSDAYGHAVLQQPVVGQVLALAQESSGSFRPMLHHDDMDEGASRCSKSLLAQASSQQLPVLNQHLYREGTEFSLPATRLTLA